MSKIKRMTWNGDIARNGDVVLFADHERVVGDAWVRTGEAELQRDNFWRQAVELRAAMAASSAEFEGLRKDAERYRWLKEGCGDDGLRVYNIHNQFSYLFDSADEAIDAAMKEQAE